MSVRSSVNYVHSRTYAIGKCACVNQKLINERGTSILVKIVVMHVSEEIIAAITLVYWKQRFTTNAKRDISTTPIVGFSRRIGVFRASVVV